MLDILSVEDNPGDRVLIQLVLRLAHPECEVEFVESTLSALARLREPGPAPEIFIVDINLGRGEGFEVLAALRGEPRFRNAPVLVFTGSALEKDIDRSYGLGASCFLTKPMDFEEYLSSLSRAITFCRRTLSRH